MKRYTRGFTLIELLVVIAIIGILASVVLVSLQSARSKGKDGRIMAEAAQLRTQLEANNDGTSYNDIWSLGPIAASKVHTGSSAWNTLVGDIGSQLGITTSITNGLYTAAPAATDITVVSGNATGASTTVALGYSIYVRLNTGGYFCIGSNGATKTGTGAIPTASNAGACN